MVGVGGIKRTRWSFIVLYYSVKCNDEKVVMKIFVLVVYVVCFAVLIKFAYG